MVHIPTKGNPITYRNVNQRLSPRDECVTQPHRIRHNAACDTAPLPHHKAVPQPQHNYGVAQQNSTKVSTSHFYFYAANFTPFTPKCLTLY
jgi:hypothetical protein